MQPGQVAPEHARSAASPGARRAPGESGVPAEGGREGGREQPARREPLLPASSAAGKDRARSGRARPRCSIPRRTLRSARGHAGGGGGSSPAHRSVPAAAAPPHLFLRGFVNLLIFFFLFIVGFFSSPGHESEPPVARHVRGRREPARCAGERRDTTFLSFF